MIIEEEGNTQKSSEMREMGQNTLTITNLKQILSENETDQQGYLNKVGISISQIKCQNLDGDEVPDSQNSGNYQTSNNYDYPQIFQNKDQILNLTTPQIYNVNSNQQQQQQQFQLQQQQQQQQQQPNLNSNINLDDFLVSSRHKVDSIYGSNPEHKFSNRFLGDRSATANFQIRQNVVNQQSLNLQQQLQQNQQAQNAYLQQQQQVQTNYAQEPYQFNPQNYQNIFINGLRSSDQSNQLNPKNTATSPEMKSDPYSIIQSRVAQSKSQQYPQAMFQQHQILQQQTRGQEQSMQNNTPISLKISKFQSRFEQELEAVDESIHKLDSKYYNYHLCLMSQRRNFNQIINQTLADIWREYKREIVLGTVTLIFFYLSWVSIYLQPSADISLRVFRIAWIAMYYLEAIFCSSKNYLFEFQSKDEFINLHQDLIGKQPILKILIQDNSNPKVRQIHNIPIQECKDLTKFPDQIIHSRHEVFRVRQHFEWEFANEKAKRVSCELVEAKCQNLKLQANQTCYKDISELPNLKKAFILYKQNTSLSLKAFVLFSLIGLSLPYRLMMLLSSPLYIQQYLKIIN